MLDNANETLLQQIQSTGMPVKTYTAGDEQSRLQAVNAVEGAKFSARDYSYEALTSKPDMQLTTIPDSTQLKRREVLDEGLRNAAEVGTTHEDGRVSVYVSDIGRDVYLSRHSLKHGLDRRIGVNGLATMKAGEIIRNSVRINELIPDDDAADASYVLIGAARNSKGQIFVVRSVVNQISGELESVDVLHAMSAKKELAAPNAPTLTENPLSVTNSSKLSIIQTVGLCQ